MVGLIARGLARYRPLRRSFAVLGVTAAVLVVIFMTAHAVTLTSVQRVERSLGFADFTASMAVGAPPAEQLPGRAEFDALGRVALVSVGVRIDGEPDRRISFIESEWDPNPFPDAMVLAEGTFPDSPSEVAVSTTLQADHPVGSTFSVLSGSGQWTVTGVYENRYAQTSYEMVAGPGTWEAMGARAREDYPTVSASGSLYWDGTDADPVLRSIIDSAAAGGVDRGSADQTARASMLSRETLLSSTPSTMVESIPLLYRWPALLIPLALGILCVSFSSRWLRGVGQTMFAVGVPRRATLTAALAVLLAGATASVISGVAVGSVIGWSVRPLVAEVISTPLSPVTWPVSELPGLILAPVLGVTAGAALLWSDPVRRFAAWSRWRASARRIGWAAIALVVAGSVLAIIRVSTRIPQVEEINAAGIGVVLLTTCGLAGAVTPLIRRLGGLGSAPLLATRIHVRDRGKVTAAVATLIVAAALPLTLATTATMFEASINRDQIPHVPARQALLGTSGMDLPMSLRQRFEDVTGLSDPVQMLYLSDATGSAALYARGKGMLVAFNTPDDVERWLGAPLTDRQRETLSTGGMLGADDKQGDHAVTVMDPSGTAHPLSLAYTHAQFPREWEVSTARGVILVETATQLSLPTGSHAFVYSGVTAEQDEKVAHAPENAGFDRVFLSRHTPADQSPIPAGVQAAVWAFALLVILVALLASRGVIAQLRPTLASLHAAGVPRRWGRAVVGAYLAPILALALVGAVCSSLAGVALVVALHSDIMVFAAPWNLYGVISASFLVGGLAAYRLAGHRLQTKERASLR
ncbi:hypothetical protein ERC79_15785 [Rhodococcus sp. ABRD24]|nr:hypothetical protein ERC79_15785 [Rhodococcus sp. ABRD24]